MGLRHSMLLVQNNGGAISVDQIAARPVALLLSGPAAGVGALALLRSRDRLRQPDLHGDRRHELRRDRDEQGDHRVTDHFEIGGYHLALPSVEIHSVGAGGGTIAGVDDAGMLFVGPQGAGAKPGPAAYGLGGDDPTITDAQIVLGRLTAGPVCRRRGDARSRSLRPRPSSSGSPSRSAISVEDAAAGMLELLDQKPAACGAAA